MYQVSIPSELDPLTKDEQKFLQNLSTENLLGWYRRTTIPKRNQKARIIEEPLPPLKGIQSKALKLLQKRFSSKELRFSTAIQNRGTAYNAAQHLGSKTLLKLDIQDCFTSTNPDLIYRHLDSSEHYFFSICFIPHPKVPNQFCLPTGAPTSPLLASIALKDIDEEIVLTLTEFKFNYTYTRYIDDLTIGFPGIIEESVLLDLAQYIDALLQSHSNERYKLNKKKTTIAYPNTHIPFEVTGICINPEHHKIPRRLRRKLRARLNNLAFNKKGINDEITQGYLSYIYSIDPQSYNEMIKLFEQRSCFYEKTDDLS